MIQVLVTTLHKNTEGGGEILKLEWRHLWTTTDIIIIFSSCSRLGLVSLGYLWRRNQSELLDDGKLEAIIVKVSISPAICVGIRTKSYIVIQIKIIFIKCKMI